MGTNDVAAQYAGDGDFLGSADSLWQVVPAGEVVYSQTNIVSVLSALWASLWLSVQPGWPFWQGVLLVTVGSLVCWGATRVR